MRLDNVHWRDGTVSEGDPERNEGRDLVAVNGGRRRFQHWQEQEVSGYQESLFRIERPSRGKSCPCPLILMRQMK